MQTPPPSPPPGQPDPQMAAYPRPPAAPSIRFEVIGQAFNMVFADIGTWAVAALVLLIAMGLVYAIAFAAVGGALMAGGGVMGMIMIELVMIFLVGTVMNLLMANMYRMAIMALSGTKPSVNEMFRFGSNAGNIIAAAFIVAVAVAIGSAFCYIPGLVIGGLFMFTMPFVVDRNMSAGAAISASMETLKKDVVMAAVFYLVISICAGIGAIALGIGVIFTLPVMPLAIAMLYRDYVGFASTAPAP